MEVILTSLGVSSFSRLARNFGSEILEMCLTFSIVRTSLSSKASTFNSTVSNSGAVTKLIHSWKGVYLHYN